IGGGYKGQDPNIPLAEHVLIDKHVQIHADALQTGNGGEVIIWSEENTEFLGSLSAKGGLEAGNGGFAEVSGKKGLSFEGRVDLRAVNGKTGNLLIDPDNINIISTGTDSATGQTFATTGTVNISGFDIGLAIDAANLTLQANQGIFIQDNISATTAGNGLTLQAGGNIFTPVTSGLTIALNGGDFSATFNDSGAINAGGPASFTADGLTINTQGGNITIQQGNLMNIFDGTISISDSSFDSGGGSIQLILSSNNSATVPIGIDVNTTTFNAGGNIILNGTGETGVVLSDGTLNSNGLISIMGSGSSGVGIEIDDQTSVAGDSVNLTATMGSILLIDSEINSDTSLTAQTPNDLILEANISLTTLQPANGTANITVGGNLELTSGSISTADAVIGGSFSVTGGALMFNVGGNVSLTSSNAETYSLIGYGSLGNSSDVTGDIIFNHVGGDVLLQVANSGTGTAGFAQIGHLSGGGLPNTLNGDISLLVDGSISVIGGSASSSSYAQIGHGGADPFTTMGDLTAIAGKNITLQSSTGPANIINEGGNVTLVTDNLFPTAPSSGPGFFSSSAQSHVSSSGEMRIYTAIRSQNQINGLINGVPFIPGALFVNTNEEMWATYYPGGSYGGGPFTIYYKDGAIEAIEDIYLFAVANSEFNAEYSDILPVVNPPIYQANLDYFSQRELIWFDPYRRVLRYRVNARNLTQ
ncbi:MAG: beta strand repeat-containing protein, partial [Candidatus Rhabdochlamydia sp.]